MGNKAFRFHSNEHFSILN